ncbi:hypothetical protein CR513_02392, partial [Mucuna pruriens]
TMEVKVKKDCKVCKRKVKKMGIRKEIESEDDYGALVGGLFGLLNLLSKLIFHDIFEHLAIGQHHNSPPMRVCGMCAFVEYPTNVCPICMKLNLKYTNHHLCSNNNNPCNLYNKIGQLATTMNQLQSKGFGQIPSHTILRIIDFSDVVEVVAMQPPMPSMVQPLHTLVITANKLQVEQKEKLLQDLKKLRDFYEHLVKHSTLRFLLKKRPKDMA